MKWVLVCCFQLFVLGLSHYHGQSQPAPNINQPQQPGTRPRFVVLRDSYNGAAYVLTDQQCSFVQKKIKRVPQTIQYPCVTRVDQDEELARQFQDKKRQLEQFRQQQQQYVMRQKEQLAAMKKKQQEIMMRRYQQYHQQVQKAYPNQYRQYIGRVHQAKQQHQVIDQKIQQYHTQLQEQQKQYDQKYQQYQQQYQKYRSQYLQYQQQKTTQNQAYWNRATVGTCYKTVERDAVYYEQFTDCCEGWQKNVDGICVVPELKNGQQAVCRNGGILKQDHGYARCLCPPNYSGRTCEQQEFDRRQPAPAAPQLTDKQNYMRMMLSRMSQSHQQNPSRMSQSQQQNPSRMSQSQQQNPSRMSQSQQQNPSRMSQSQQQNNEIPPLPPKQTAQSAADPKIFNSISSMYKAKVLHKFLQAYPQLRQQVVGLLAAKQLYDGQQKSASKARAVANLMQNYIREKQKQLSIVTNTINQVMNMRKSLSKQMAGNRAKVMYALRDKMARVLRERMDNKRNLLKRLRQLRVSMRMSKLAMLVKYKLLQASISNKPEFRKFIDQITRNIGARPEVSQPDEDEEEGNMTYGPSNIRMCVADFDEQFKTCFIDYGIDARRALFLTQTMAYGTVYSHPGIMPLYIKLCGQRNLIEQCVNEAIVSCDGVPQMQVVSGNVNRLFTMLDTVCHNVPGTPSDESSSVDDESPETNEVTGDEECFNGGLVVEDGGDNVCQCPDGFSGDRCETEDDLGGVDGDVIDSGVNDMIDPSVDYNGNDMLDVPPTDYSADDVMPPTDYSADDVMPPTDYSAGDVMPPTDYVEEIVDVLPPNDYSGSDVMPPNDYNVDPLLDASQPVTYNGDGLSDIPDVPTSEYAPDDSVYHIETPADLSGSDGNYGNDQMLPPLDGVDSGMLPPLDIADAGQQSLGGGSPYRVPYFTNCPQHIVTLTLPTDSNVTSIPFALDARDWTGNALQTSVSQTTFHWKSHSIETVMASASDAMGHVAKCIFAVTVTDPFSPKFVHCPSDIRVSTDEEPADWDAVVAKDNVGLTSNPKGDYKPGSTFPPGTTQVTYVAEDLAGNVEYCRFTVHVEKSVKSEKDVLHKKIDENSILGAGAAVPTSVAKVVGGESSDNPLKMNTMMIIIMSAAVVVLLIAILIAVVACVCLRRRKNVFVIEKKPEQLNEVCTISGRPPSYETKGIPPLSYEEVKGETIKGSDDTSYKNAESDCSKF